MSATKILWGQLIVVGLIVLAFVWAATQWTAWRLGYQPQLGAPWFELWPAWPVYQPPAFFWWWFALRRLRAAYLRRGCLHRRIRRLCRHRGRDRHVGLARPGSDATHHLRLGPVGRDARGPRRRPARRRRRHPRPLDGATCAMTGRSTSCASRRPAAARASAWWSRRCSPGRASRSCTTSRARTGR